MTSRTEIDAPKRAILRSDKVLPKQASAIKDIDAPKVVDHLNESLAPRRT
jgi:hypothetical protein